MPDRRQLTLDEAAEMLKCSKKTLTREIAAGNLHAYKIRNRWHVDFNHLRDYIGQHQYAAAVERKHTIITPLDAGDLVETTCMLTCGQRPGGAGGGVSMMLQDTMIMLHACSHLPAFLHATRDELMGLGWQNQVDFSADSMDRVNHLRDQQLRYLAADYPLNLPDSFIRCDALQEPLLHVDGTLTGWLAIMVPPGSPWRDNERIHAVVSFADEPKGGA